MSRINLRKTILSAPRSARTQGAIKAAGVISVLLMLTLYGLWWKPLSAARSAAKAYDLSALAALRMRDDEAAEREWLNALADWPDDPEALMQLGDFYRSHHELEAAGVCYLRLLKSSPHHNHIYCRLAAAASEYGSSKDARSFAEKELAKDPGCVRALVIEAALDRHVGNLKRAEDESGKAYKLAPTDEDAVTGYAETIMTSNPAAAAKILEAAAVRLPRSTSVAFELAWCDDHLAVDPQSAARAEKALRRAETLNPGNGTLHSEACRFLLQQNEVAAALKEGEEAAKLAPYDPQAVFGYSQALARSGQTAAAAAAQKRFISLQDAKDRQAELQRRYGIHPGDPTIAHQLIEVDTLLGQFNDAMIVANLAVDVHPRDKGAQRDLERLIRMGVAP